jgi:hypothetical protein
VSDDGPQAFDGSLSGLSQERLELGEGVFDRIEVWRVRRQIEQARTCRLDHLAHLRSFVAGQIVDDDDVALSQFGGQNTLDVSLEGAAVDGAVEDEGGDHASRGQAGGESRRFPVAMGDADAQSFAAAATAVRSGHVGRGPGLIDENKTLGIEIELLLEPRLSALQDVWPILFAGVRCLFLRVMAWRTKKRRIVP